MEFFVDFEGFYTYDNRFIVKEIILAPLTDSNSEWAHQLLFKPPMDSHEEVILYPSKDYLGRQHLVPWDAGDIPYENLETELKNILQDTAYIYVLGPKKKEWLSEIIHLPLIDLSKMPFIDALEHYAPFDWCKFRKRISYGSVHKYGCPYENVQRMREWFWQYWGPDPTPERSLQYFNQLQYLSEMTASDIACLDESIILQQAYFQIHYNWSKLPEHLQADHRFIGYLRCTEHWISDQSPGHDVIDGPAPYKKNCMICKREKNFYVVNKDK